MAAMIVVDALVIFVIFIFTLETAALCFFVGWGKRGREGIQVDWNVQKVRDTKW